MRDLRKVVPPKREILRGIYLSFFPGAKIGVLGANGAGKSTLLRIMAGVDPDFLGEARPADGIRIGYLPQEPRLDPAKNVLGNIEEGVATTRDLLRRFEEVSARFAEPMSDAEMEKLLGRAGTPPGRDRGRGRLGAGPDGRDRDGRAPRPAGRPGRRHALRRRGAARRALPAAPRAARHAAARRADQPPRRRVRGLAGAVPPGVPRHGGGGHPRPLLPRQRGRLDPGARPRPRHPVAGELLLLARAEAGAPRAGGEGGGGPPADPRARAGVDPDGARAPGRPRARPASRPTRRSSSRRSSAAATTSRS